MSQPHDMGVPASPSDSTLQPSVSAAIPNAWAPTSAPRNMRIIADRQNPEAKSALNDGADVLEATEQKLWIVLQAITDPENQPSQYGTVTLEMHQAVEAENALLREVISDKDAALELMREALAELRSKTKEHP